MKFHATALGDNTGHTDASTNVNNNDRPITERVSNSAGVRPITARSALPDEKPAEIQMRDPESGRLVHPEYLTKGPVITNDMFQRWTPDLLGLPSDSRPVRSTRNRNPNYVDSIWSASKEEIAVINASISSSPA